MAEAEDRPSTLSMRARERFGLNLEHIMKYTAEPAVRNPYDEKENPEGIINLGTAVSSVMDDVLLKRFSEKAHFIPNANHFRYYKFWGVDSFRATLAKFMIAFFRPREPIVPDDLYVFNGAVLSLDLLTLMLADEGDSFLYFVPGYSSYRYAGKQRWQVNMVPVPLPYNEQTGTFGFSAHSIEKVISEEEEKNGRKVRAFVLNNPENPTGKVFLREDVENIMKICQRRKIHLVADEVYCMSVFGVEKDQDEDARFHSVLEIHTPELLDPNYLHVIWGFSKDLCLTSFRTGVIHTKNKELGKALISGSLFQAVPLPILQILENFISDIEWIQSFFVPTNHERLKANYERCRAYFQSLQIPVSVSAAGFFFLADFRSLFNPPSKEATKAFLEKLYSKKVYITPSWEMGAEDGWFRIVFSAYTGTGLELGLARLLTAITEWKAEHPVP